MLPIVGAAHNYAAPNIQRPLGRDLKGEPTDCQQMAAQGRLPPFAKSRMNDCSGWKAEVPETTATSVINVAGTANGAASTVASPAIIAARSRADPAARVQPSGP
jgi:hypothetical protein